jgi:hypothetical protein
MLWCTHCAAYLRDINSALNLCKKLQVLVQIMAESITAGKNAKVFSLWQPGEPHLAATRLPIVSPAAKRTQKSGVILPLQLDDGVAHLIDPNLLPKLAHKLPSHTPAATCS